MSTNYYAMIPAVSPVRLEVLSAHADLTSACKASQLRAANSPEVLDHADRVDRPYAYRSAEAGERWVRPCTEAYVTEDGAVWYVTEGDLMLFHRVPALAGPSPTHYGLAYIVGGGSAIEFYAFAFPDDARGREILRAIQAGLNRPIAYYHAPRG